MKNHRLLTALTAVNLGLLIYLLSNLGANDAQAQGQGQIKPDILRGKGLEIVDDNGKVRAAIQLLPGNETVTMPNGKPQPETVILRLITADGKPRVKLSTSDQGSGLLVLGESDDSYAILSSDLKESRLKLRDSEKVQTILKP